MILDDENILIGKTIEDFNNPFKLLKELLYGVDDFRSKNEDIHKIIHHLNIPELKNYELRCVISYTQIQIIAYDIYGYAKFRLIDIGRINNYMLGKDLHMLDIDLLTESYIGNLYQNLLNLDYIKLKKYILQLKKQYNFKKKPSDNIYYNLMI